MALSTDRYIDGRGQVKKQNEYTEVETERGRGKRSRGKERELMKKRKEK